MKTAPGLVVAALFSSAAARAQAPADFYRANPIHLVVAATTGESYDAAARLVARHLGRFVPGNPRVVVDNMGGAAGRLAANHLYNVAPRDGSTIGELLQTFALGQALGEDGIRYDARNFSFIGSPITPVDVFVTRASSGVLTMADATRTEIAIGSTGATSQNHIYPALSNALLGTRFKIVGGYKGGNDINIAFERGEAQGRGAFPWSQLKAEHEDWLKSGFVAMLAQSGFSRDAELPDTPTFVELASNDARGVFEFLSLTTEIGRPLVAPPGAPGDRVAALRAGFDAMAADADFRADAAKMHEAVAPKNGGALAAIARRIVEFDAGAVARFKAAVAAAR